VALSSLDWPVPQADGLGWYGVAPLALEAFPQIIMKP
jgi:hypothetical protein